MPQGRPPPRGPPSPAPAVRVQSAGSGPTEPIRVAEFAATGSLSTRRFQGLERGKTEQRGALGSRSAAAEPDRAATRSAVAKTGPALIRPVSALLPLRLELRLVRALLGLVGLERIGRVDVAERRVVWRQFARRLDAESLCEHRAERL